MPYSGRVYHSESCAYVLLWLCVENSTTKQRGHGNQLRKKRESSLICFPNYSGGVDSQQGLGNICIFSCVGCSAASHATRGQPSAVVSQGDPLEERREVKGKIVFIVPLVGAFKSNRSGSSLPGLRGEVIDLSQVLHGRAFVGVRQLDPHS